MLWESLRKNLNHPLWSSRIRKNVNRFSHWVVCLLNHPRSWNVSGPVSCLLCWMNSLILFFPFSSTCNRVKLVFLSHSTRESTASNMREPIRFREPSNPHNCSYCFVFCDGCRMILIPISLDSFGDKEVQYCRQCHRMKPLRSFSRRNSDSTCIICNACREDRARMLKGTSCRQDL